MITIVPDDAGEWLRRPYAARTLGQLRQPVWCGGIQISDGSLSGTGSRTKLWPNGFEYQTGVHLAQSGIGTQTGR